jgi:hypothetical protein
MAMRDNTVEAVKKGDKGAVKTEEGWQSFDEAQQAASSEGFGRGAFVVMRARNMKLPADEAQDLAGKAKELKKTGDTYESDLTEAGAKGLLTFRGFRGGNANFTPPEPTNAKGSVKFWTKDGQLAKYEYRVQGTISIQGQDRDIDRTTSVEIKDVGTTKVEVPAEAKGKV